MVKSRLGGLFLRLPLIFLRLPLIFLRLPLIAGSRAFVSHHPRLLSHPQLSSITCHLFHLFLFVFDQIVKCICPYCKIYLSKSWNVFVSHHPRLLSHLELSSIINHLFRLSLFLICFIFFSVSPVLHYLSSVSAFCPLDITSWSSQTHFAAAADSCRNQEQRRSIFSIEEV